LNIGVGEGDALVDLAGEAPSGGEVDEDRVTGGKLAGNFLLRPRQALWMMGN